MVGGGPLGWENGLGARELLSTTGLERSHCLVVPYFGGEVGVWDWNLRGHVGDNISVMDDAVSLGHLCREETSKGLVTDSGLTKRVKLVYLPEYLLEIECCDGSQSTS